MRPAALVTGAGGFIGQHVVRQLQAEGYEVSGIFRNSVDKERLSDLGLVRWSDAGVSPETLSQMGDGIDEIYHCAGSGSVALSLQRPQDDFDCNVLTTQYVLEYARCHKGVKVILPSSAGVYGSVKEMPITVDAPPNPISPYGVNKHICEIMLRQYAVHFNVPVVSVRLFSVYGPGLCKQLLWDASHKLLRGDTVFFGTGDETRDWINVADAAKLLVWASKHADSTGKVFNGGTGRSVKIRNIINSLAEHYGVTVPVVFNGQNRPGDPLHYQADMVEAMQLGWTPEVSLEAGLIQYAEWFDVHNRSGQQPSPEDSVEGGGA